jgi:hypothetical protein
VQDIALEVYKIRKMVIRYFSGRKNKEMLVSLSDSFTKYIFQYLDVDEDQEIGLDCIKSHILEEKDGWELFCLFCGADT